MDQTTVLFIFTVTLVVLILYWVTIMVLILKLLWKLYQEMRWARSWRRYYWKDEKGE